MLRRLCASTIASGSSSILILAKPSTAIRNDLWSTTQAAGVHHHLERGDMARFTGQERSNTRRANRNTHVNEKMFRKMRGRKTVLLKLPDDEDKRRMDSLTPSELRNEMLRKGINPYKEVQPRQWQEQQITMSSFYSVIDPYVTNEDPLPFIIPSNAKESVQMKYQEVKDRSLHRWHNWQNGKKRIRRKEGFEKFEPKTFGPTADVIFEEAHKALMARDKPRLHKYITEHAFAKMWPDVESGSIDWEIIERLTPSKVVTVRCGDYPYKSGNDIAQLTVRMHTKQRLAVYDRFGHLILGSKTEPKEVLEYVVFENHIAMTDGAWRLHDKVYPRWAQEKTPSAVTTMIENIEDRPTTTASLPLRVEEMEKARRKRAKEGKSDEEE